MKPTYRQDTKYFEYHNENPRGLKSAGDCVVRALAFALNMSWDEVFEELCDIARELKRMPNDDKVFETYLEKRRWFKNPQPRKPDGRKFTVQEFAKLHPKATYIIRVASHLTVVKEGKIHDTWNCGDCCVGNYWI